MDFIELNGKSYRVETNWNAIMAFLEALGTDDMAAVDMTKPRNWAPMMAAAINEGERLEGRECNFTAMELGAMPDFIQAATHFVQIYVRQSTPGNADESKKD